MRRRLTTIVLGFAAASSAQADPAAQQQEQAQPTTIFEDCACHEDHVRLCPPCAREHSRELRRLRARSSSSSRVRVRPVTSADMNAYRGWSEG